MDITPSFTVSQSLEPSGLHSPEQNLLFWAFIGQSWLCELCSSLDPNPDQIALPHTQVQIVTNRMWKANKIVTYMYISRCLLSLPRIDALPGQTSRFKTPKKINRKKLKKSGKAQKMQKPLKNTIWFQFGLHHNGGARGPGHWVAHISFIPRNKNNHWYCSEFHQNMIDCYFSSFLYCSEWTKIKEY